MNLKHSTNHRKGRLIRKGPSHKAQSNRIKKYKETTKINKLSKSGYSFGFM